MRRHCGCFNFEWPLLVLDLAMMDDVYNVMCLWMKSYSGEGYGSSKNIVAGDINYEGPVWIRAHTGQAKYRSLTMGKRTLWKY